jgi:hypothetical protein
MVYTLPILDGLNFFTILLKERISLLNKVMLFKSSHLC